MGNTIRAIIAERSEANNRVLWAQQSQLAFILYIIIQVVVLALLAELLVVVELACCARSVQMEINYKDVICIRFVGYI